MRSVKNFSPEWGYLAPAPSLARTARVVLVATAIGATAGAGVVLSLVERPAEAQKTPIAARAIVTSVRETAVPSVAPTVSTAAVSSPATAVNAAPVPASGTSASATSLSASNSGPAPAPATVGTRANANVSVAAASSSAATVVIGSSEAPKAADAAPADVTGNPSIIAPETQAPKKAKRHASGKAAPGLGSILRRLFVAHSGRSYYPHSANGGL
jgi:hypothetical protein